MVTIKSEREIELMREAGKILASVHEELGKAVKPGISTKMCIRDRHDTVDVPSSKMKLAIADILVKEGYVAKYDMVEDGGFQTIRITLKYGKDKNEKIISGIKRISKPGLRVYANKEELPRVLGGLGTAIISTNQGVITDKEARQLGVGGEVLAFVW